MQNQKEAKRGEGWAVAPGPSLARGGVQGVSPRSGALSPGSAQAAGGINKSLGFCLKALHLWWSPAPGEIRKLWGGREGVVVVLFIF